MVDMGIVGKAQLTWKAGDLTAKRPAAMSEHRYLLKRYLGEDGQPRFTSSAPVIGIGGSPFTNMRTLEDQVRSLEEAIQHSPIGFGREAIGEVIGQCFSFFEDANASVQTDMESLLPERNKEKQHRASEEDKAVRGQASAVAMGEGGKE